MPPLVGTGIVTEARMEEGFCFDEWNRSQCQCEICTERTFTAKVAIKDC